LTPETGSCSTLLPVLCRGGRSQFCKLRLISRSKIFEPDSGPRIFQNWESDSCSDSGSIIDPTEIHAYWQKWPHTPATAGIER